MGMNFYASKDDGTGQYASVFSSKEQDIYIYKDGYEPKMDPSMDGDGYNDDVWIGPEGLPDDATRPLPIPDTDHLIPNPDFLVGCELHLSPSTVLVIMQALGYLDDRPMFCVPADELAARCAAWLLLDPDDMVGPQPVGFLHTWVGRISHLLGFPQSPHSDPLLQQSDIFRRIILQLQGLIRLGVERGATVIYAI